MSFARRLSRPLVWWNPTYFQPAARGLLQNWLVFSLLVGSCSTLPAANVQVAWDPNPEPDIIGYNIYYGPLDGDSENVATTSGTNIILDDLAAGTVHAIYATAFNAGAESEPSNIITYTTPPPVIDISWDATPAANLQNYRLFYRLARDSGWSRIDTGKRPNAVLLNYRPRTQLELFVEARNTVGGLCDLYANTALTVPPRDVVPVKIPRTKARFAFVDRTRLGDWPGVYGANGLSLAADGTRWPSTLAPVNGVPLTWQIPSFNISAFKSVVHPYRTAAAWTTVNGAVQVNLPFPAGQVNRVSLYCLDFQKRGVQQVLEVVDAQSGAVITANPLSDFGSGVYMAFDVIGPAYMRVRGLNGHSALVSGVFLDASYATPP